MSYYVANENGMIDQFASGMGYTDLCAAASGNAVLRDFFDNGFIEDDEVPAVISELEKLAAKAPEDIADTAKTLARLIKDQEVAIIYTGNETSEAPDDGASGE